MSGSAGFGAREAGFVALRKRVPEKITGTLRVPLRVPERDLGGF